MQTPHRVDDHKLIFHPERVAEWLKGSLIAPVYMEFGLSGACNHRCRFCAFDFLKYKTAFLDADVFIPGLQILAEAGVKSILFSGEGEPLMHPRAPEIIRSVRNAGIDVALATNGVLLRDENMEAAVESCTWLKLSIDAGTPETHAYIHGTGEKDFSVIMNNLARAAAYRRKIGSSCTLGTQAILLPDNRDELVSLASQVRDAGADYLVIKAYSQHPLSGNADYKNVHYGQQLALARALEAESTREFQVVFRQESMSRHENARPYDHCLALPFWAHVDAHGNVWACSAYIGDDRFFLGNMNENGFDEILHSTRRLHCVSFAAKDLSVSGCRTGCRMDRINGYLWELVHPDAHVNFI